jgi:hypothetical protein
MRSSGMNFLKSNLFGYLNYELPIRMILKEHLHKFFDTFDLYQVGKFIHDENSYIAKPVNVNLVENAVWSNNYYVDKLLLNKVVIAEVRGYQTIYLEFDVRWFRVINMHEEEKYWRRIGSDSYMLTTKYVDKFEDWLEV